MVVPVLLALTMATIASLDWRECDVDEEGPRPAEAGDATETEAALHAFSLLAGQGQSR